MTKLRILLIIFSIVFISLPSISQTTFKISGTVSSGSTAVPFSTILIKKNSDSTVVKFGISDSLGSFNIIGVPAGNYFAKITSVGFKDFNSNQFEVSNTDVALGEITMTLDNELATVQVVKIRPVIEIHPDKTVFNVENTLNATGTNGFDLLRKAPGVIIDNNNDLIVEGKSGVQIYIDNKPSVLAGDDLINFLRSLQAADIDKIEIITQPSSKFDAAGSAGIINIILKRDKNLGTNGTLTTGYTYGVKGDNHLSNSSISLNHRRKSFNVYTSYSNNFGGNYSFFNLDRTQYGYLYESETTNKESIRSHNAKLGADWYINKTHTIGVMLSGNYFDRNGTANTETFIIPLASNLQEQKLFANNSGVGINNQAAANINYRFADTSGHEFSIDLDYAKYSQSANNYQPNLYLNENNDTLFENNYRMISPIDISIYSVKADYSQYLWKGKLSTGVKFSYVITDNIFDFYHIINNEDMLDIDRSNQFIYNENINTAYLNYAKKLGQKWNLQLGLRAEHTRSFGDLISTQSSPEDSVRREYVNLFPSGGLTYAPNRKHLWSLTFSKRIQRPNYQSLNPFVSQLTELSFRKGNPFLQPSYAYNTKISHTFNYRFTTSISYSYTEDYFAQVTDTLGLDKSYLISLNVANQSTTNLGFSLPFSIKKWWSMYLSINGTINEYIGTDEKFTPLIQPTASFYGQNSFLLPASFKLEISGWFSTPSVWGGTYKTKSMGSIDAAVEKKIFKERLSIRLDVSDIFYTSFWRADATFGDVYFEGSGGWDSQKLTFNLTYNFGNREMKKIKDRKTGLEEEGKRVGGE